MKRILTGLTATVLLFLMCPLNGFSSQNNSFFYKKKKSESSFYQSFQDQKESNSDSFFSSSETNLFAPGGPSGPGTGPGSNIDPHENGGYNRVGEVPAGDALWICCIMITGYIIVQCRRSKKQAIKE